MAASIFADFQSSLSIDKTTFFVFTMILCYTSSMSKSTYLAESDFQQAVVDLARLHRWLVYHTYDSRRSTPGFPDLVLARDGKLVFAELKSEGNSPSEAQQHWLNELQLAHPHVFVWRPSDWRDIEVILR